MVTVAESRPVGIARRKQRVARYWAVGAVVIGPPSERDLKHTLAHEVRRVSCV